MLIIIPIVRIRGRYHASYALGIVGDYCPLCRNIRPFHLLEDMLVEHRNFVPSGGASQLRVYRECLTCHTETPCLREQYTEVLPLNEARELSFNQLLQRTNPHVADLREEERRLAELLSTEADFGSETARKLATVRLEICHGPAEDIKKYTRRLAQWGGLTAADRQQLLRDIDAYVAQCDESARVALFTQQYCRAAPKRLHRFASLLGIPLVAAAAYLIFLLLDDPQAELRHAMLLGGIVGALLLGFFLFLKVRRIIYWRFFAKHVVPAAAAKGIELGLIREGFDMLRLVAGLPGPVRSLLRHRRELLEVIEQARAKQAPAPALRGSSQLFRNG